MSLFGYPRETLPIRLRYSTQVNFKPFAIVMCPAPAENPFMDAKEMSTRKWGFLLGVVSLAPLAWGLDGLVEYSRSVSRADGPMSACAFLAIGVAGLLVAMFWRFQESGSRLSRRQMNSVPKRNNPAPNVANLTHHALPQLRQEHSHLGP